ncbi:hypothetical protein V1477_019339 [Vespula maculifrons]|uniref:Uncharacterized protein n=1 Tax=Vespula maculifrons TaxID=7453 RepID=A0ABD2AS84_VESMC
MTVTTMTTKTKTTKTKKKKTKTITTIPATISIRFLTWHIESCFVEDQDTFSNRAAATVVAAAAAAAATAATACITNLGRIPFHKPIREMGS